MAKKKEGGRQKGTPNKITAVTKEFIVQFLSDYKDGKFGKTCSLQHDFLLLEPMERLTIMTKLLKHTVPTLASTNVDLSSTEDRKKTVEETMSALAELNNK